MSRTKVLTVRVTEPLDELVNSYVNIETYLNKSDFVRSAIREKIVRDAPHLIKEMIDSKNKGIKDE